MCVREREDIIMRVCRVCCVFVCVRERKKIDRKVTIEITIDGIILFTARMDIRTKSKFFFFRGGKRETYG